METKEKLESFKSIFNEVKIIYDTLSKFVPAKDAGFNSYLFIKEAIKKFYYISDKKELVCIDKLLFLFSSFKNFLGEDFDFYVEDMIDDFEQKYGTAFMKAVTKLESFVTSLEFKNYTEANIDEFVDGIDK